MNLLEETEFENKDTGEVFFSITCFLGIVTKYKFIYICSNKYDNLRRSESNSKPVISNLWARNHWKGGTDVTCTKHGLPGLNISLIPIYPIIFIFLFFYPIIFNRQRQSTKYKIM